MGWWVEGVCFFLCGCVFVFSVGVGRVVGSMCSVCFFWMFVGVFFLEFWWVWLLIVGFLGLGFYWFGFLLFYCCLCVLKFVWLEVCF